MLESIGDSLIRVYGQHEHHTLRQSDTHLGLLDAFAGHGALAETMRTRFAAHHDLAERLRRVLAGKETARARAELLRFQVKEIIAAGLTPGEEEELRQERQVLGAAEKLAEAARFGEHALYAGESAAASTVRKLSARLGELVDTDPRLGEIAKLVDEAYTLVEEAGWRLREYAEKLVFDPERLEEVDGRLLELSKLKRKYGDSIDAILALRDAAVRELGDLDLNEEGLAALEGEAATTEKAAREAAAALSKSRRGAAKRLEGRVRGELGELGMKDARFEVRFADEAPLSSDGVDRVEFFFSANAGEEPRALARIASGGELSRIMLALKSLALEDADAPTVIFDEVDAGIGGAVAEVVGRKLATLARRRQVLCITHLPQIAAFADHHFAVEKATERGRTRSTARRLGAEERVRRDRAHARRREDHHRGEEARRAAPRHGTQREKAMKRGTRPLFTTPIGTALENALEDFRRALIERRVYDNTENLSRAWNGARDFVDFLLDGPGVLKKWRQRQR